MRSSIGGWVENSRPTARGRNGLAIISDEVGCSWGESRSGSIAGPRSSLRRGTAGELGARGVRSVLAGPADGELHHGGGDRTENDQQQHLQQVRPALLIVA